ncbi:MAG: T9SS type A sorting domain-containing protein [Owenweeksia sp.]
MKLKFTYILLLGLTAAMLSGQPYFNRIHAWGETQPELLMLDSGYVTMLKDYRDKNKLVIREYNWLGDVVDSAYYLFDATAFTTGHCLFKLPGKEEFISALSLDGTTRFVKFNRQWDTLHTNSFRIDSSYAVVHSLLPDSDSTFMACGRFDDKSTNRSHLYLIRLDTALNVLWEKRYYDTTMATFGGYFGGYVIPAGKGFMIGAGGFYASQRSNKSFIIGTNASGNELWKKDFSNKKGLGLARLAPRKDDSYFYIIPEILDTHLTFSRPMTYRFGIIDTLGNILIKKQLGPILNYLGSGAFTQTLDGHFVTGGYTSLPGGKDVSYLFKFTENGDSIWHRFHWHGYPEGLSIIYTARATPDTGLVIAGDFLDTEDRYYRFGGPTNYTWLMKLDQYGCDTAGCEQVSLPEVNLPQTRLEVYPNPVNNYVQLHWAEQQDEVAVKIYNSTGQLIDHRIFKNIQDAEIATHRWPAGIYHLKLISKGKEQALTLVKE